MDAPITRRRALGAALALGVLAVAPGCTATGTENSPPPDAVAPELDPLRPLAASARADSALATAAAANVDDPDPRAVLTAVGAQRQAHAEALEAEIVRAAGTVDGTPVAAAPATPVTPASTGADAAAVVRALEASQADATGVALSAAGYRAGLLGSVAASCAAAVVALS